MVTLAEVRAMPERNVAGLMTGTSMDGLDVALCRIRPGARLRFDLLAFETVAMPAPLRAALASERLADLATLARLHVEGGRFFADALASVLAKQPLELHLIGSHGQTLYHEHGVTSLQIGEASALALRFGCPVVHDFRMADIAAGGCGAPLVPYVDHRLLAGRGEALLAVNIGGIANITALPRDDSDIDALIGMDCGPGNMVLDRLVERCSRGAGRVDVDGRMAARGQVREDVLASMKAHPFFAQSPPKSAGREQFGQGFVETLLERAAPATEHDWCDLMATAAELSASAIHDGYLRHVAPVFAVDAVVVAGGGARNPEIMRRLAARFAPIPVRSSDVYGLPVDAKEAIAFAVLASDRIDGLVSNVPSVTGAGRRVRLGKIAEV